MSCYTCYKAWLTVVVKSSSSSSRSSTNLFVRRPCNTSFSENEGQSRIVLPSNQWADTRRQVSGSYLLVPFQSHRLTIQSISVAILKTYTGPHSLSSSLSGSPIAQPDRVYLRLPSLVEDGPPEAPIVRPKTPPRKDIFTNTTSSYQKQLSTKLTITDKAPSPTPTCY
jgi:hypothetical protein